MQAGALSPSAFLQFLKAVVEAEGGAGGEKVGEMRQRLKCEFSRGEELLLLRGIVGRGVAGRLDFGQLEEMKIGRQEAARQLRLENRWRRPWSGDQARHRRAAR